MKLREMICASIFVAIGLLPGGEIAPSQKEWFSKYRKQVNAPNPAKMLLNTDAEPELKEGFVSLLNGKNLSNWESKGGNRLLNTRMGWLREPVFRASQALIFARRRLIMRTLFSPAR